MKIQLSETYAIRRYRFSDAEALTRHANNIKIWRNMQDTFPYPYTLEKAKWWINRTLEEEVASNFTITKDDEVIGGIGFLHRDNVFRKTMEIGYWLGEAHWGRGVVTQAVQAMIDYIFKKFDIACIEGRVFGWNVGSMRVLEKVGFEKEGILKKRVFKDGEYTDLHIYGYYKK